MINIYVGNLPFSVVDEDLREAFSQYGTVTSASVIVFKDTGRSKGFGFVEMSDPAEGKAAIEAMNDKDFKGRNLRVNEARPKEA